MSPGARTSVPAATEPVSGGLHPTIRARVGENLAGRRAPRLLVAGVALAYLGVTLIKPDLPAGLSMVDFLLLGLCGYSLTSMTHQGSPATSGVVRMFPWLWCILLGSFLGLAGVGMAFWATDNLIRTTFALLTFVCFWHLLIAGRLQRAAIAGTVVGFALTCGFLLFASTNVRGQALFPHANYAGHYCAMATVICLSVARTWYWKVLALIGLAIALQQTSSFGAMAMAVAMGAVYVVRALTRYTAILATGLAILAIAGLFLATPQAADLVPSDGSSWSLSETISEDRFDRSQSGRLQIWGQALEAWADSPLGVGPDGVRQRKVASLNGFYLEIHSDPLGYLVERGILGLIGFVGLWTTLILMARKRGIARVLIVGLLVSGFFRETMHYRHLWLLLALAFAIDHLRNQADAEAAAEAEADPDGVDGTRAVDDPTPVRDPSVVLDEYFPGTPRWVPRR